MKSAYTERLSIENSDAYKGYTTKIGRGGAEFVDKFLPDDVKKVARDKWKIADEKVKKYEAEFEQILVNSGLYNQDVQKAEFEFRKDDKFGYVYILKKGIIYRSMPDNNEEFKGFYRILEGMKFSLGGRLLEGYIETTDANGISSTIKKLVNEGSSSKIEGKSEVTIRNIDGLTRLFGKMEIAEGANWYQLAKDGIKLDVESYDPNNLSDVVFAEDLTGIASALIGQKEKVFNKLAEPSFWKEFNQAFLGQLIYGNFGYFRYKQKEF